MRRLRSAGIPIGLAVASLTALGVLLLGPAAAYGATGNTGYPPPTIATTTTTLATTTTTTASSAAGATAQQAAANAAKDQSLAFTGADIAAMTVGGLALVALGSFLVILVRRRVQNGETQSPG
jgi:hypothetical protein